MSRPPKGSQCDLSVEGSTPSAELLRAVLDSLPVSVFLRDTDGRLRFLNAECARTWKVSPAQVLGTFGENVFPAAQVKGFLAQDAQVLELGEEASFEELRWNALLGEDRLVRTVKRPLKVSAGQAQGVVGCYFDITEQKRSDHELRRHRVRLASVVESALDGIITCDADGNVLILNAAAEAMFGVLRSDVLGKPMERFLPKRFREKHPNWMREFGASPQVHRRMSGPGRVFALRADGSEFPVEASISHTSVDGEALFTVVLRDISARVQQEKALRESEQAVVNLNHRLELAVKGSGFGVWEFELDTGRLIWDEQMHRLYGYAPDGFGGDAEEWRSNLHPDDVEIVDQRFDDLMRGMQVPLFLFRIIRRNDGLLRYVEANGYMQSGPDGKPQRLVGMNRDVTDRVEAETALRQLNAELEQRVEARTAELSEAKNRADEASRAKSEFLANMSHELRTPLHSILGFVKLAIEDDAELSEAQRMRFLQRIHNSGNVLLGLVNDLLDSAKIEARRMALTRARVDLAPLLAAVLDEFQIAMQDKKVTLAGDRVQRAPAHADAARLSQAVRNVIANALRFTPEESTLTVELRPNSRGWLISVTDQGPGIPESERDIIFEPFTQSSLSGTGAGGTGLGLPITRGIVELHGGRVWCEPRPLGACFRIELPREHSSL